MSKGDIHSQRALRRDRYRGCRVCGISGVQCIECTFGSRLVAIHGYANLSLIIDGSYVPMNNEPEARCELGYAGAGLVLVIGDVDGEVIASMSCGFLANNSSDAELQAVIRGGRWAPGVTMYTDSKETCQHAIEVNKDLSVRYLQRNQRPAAHDLAHRLSVEGRCRNAPEELRATSLSALRRAPMSKRQRKLFGGVDILLERAAAEPNFNGDFVALAEQLGWTNGRCWQGNPSIRIAAERWAAETERFANEAIRSTVVRS